MGAALEAGSTAVGVLADSLERTVRQPDLRQLLLDAAISLESGQSRGVRVHQVGREAGEAENPRAEAPLVREVVDRERCRRRHPEHPCVRPGP
jgi:hypothetical protein